MRRTIAIIGAGPAGLALALRLHRAGEACIILERFEKAAPVGSGLMLQPTGLAVLGVLGLAGDIERRGVPIRQLLGHDIDGNRRVLDVRYDALAGNHCGIGIQRAALFSVLHDAVVGAGIPIITGADIVQTRERGDGIQLIDAAGNRHGPFDLAIDASGARSRLVSTVAPDAPNRDLPWGAFWATLPADGMPFHRDRLEQRYVAARRMVGLLPVGQAEPGAPEKVAFFWSVKTADAESVRARGISAFRDEVRAVWPDIAPVIDEIVDWDQLTLARYRHRTIGRPYSGRLVLVGDAAHSTSPQLGQGANMALLDAEALALALSRNDNPADAFAEYAWLRRGHVRLYQAMSRLFTPFYQSDSLALAYLRDRVVAPLSRLAPAQQVLAMIVTGLIGNPLARLELAGEIGNPRWQPEDMQRETTSSH